MTRYINLLCLLSCRYFANTSLKAIFCICLLITTSVYGQDIRINKTGTDPREQWPIKLLNLAFSYHPDKDFKLVELDSVVNQARLRAMLGENALDVAWVGTTPEMEEQFLPIRVPLYKGLLGHRIFIIRKGDQYRFSAVKTFQDLRQLKAGQGRFWGDTQIMESARIPVVKPVKYENLFYMLDGGRFDYFPRAVHEPWAEYQARPELALEIEKELMLIYPMPLYFFTNKSNPELANVIEIGLIQAVEDGTFDKMFYQNPGIKSAIEKADIKSRRAFRIDNPSLSPMTPLDNKKLWVDIEAL